MTSLSIPSERPVPSTPLRVSSVLVPPPPEGDGIPDWHLALDLRPLRPPPGDLMASIQPRPRRALAKTEPPPVRYALGGAGPVLATVLVALLLGALVGLGTGRVLRAHARHARPSATVGATNQ